ncbi:hypothetical protein JMJ35_010622 [Cladonia borealis]|uniref:Uncharacterized protein n=1 Tax=Cladonia borealis TaxID=184061 RepID=A0AA39UX54_9LECA|nr:hypothetical protein JMJ35_010622 [Cladonia borealis]
MDIFEAQPQEAFPPPCVTQEQRLSPSQQANIDQDDMARLYRIPPMGEDRVPMMTLRELLDWKADWHAKRRPPTKSERLDFDECDRQLDEVASETTMDWEEFDRNEQEMDTCPSPTQRNHPAWTKDYQIGRELRKRPLSPPRTPPHLRGPGLYKQQHAGLVPNGGSYRITKGKRDYAKTPRRPITRSTATPKISLHDRKGYVKFWHTMTQYVIISYEKYLRDYDREELDKYPVEPMDCSREDPKNPHKTDYQREVCRRIKARKNDPVKFIPVSSWRGNK